MRTKNILIISYVFPPIPYGGTYRALRLCRGLEEKSFQCHVVTLKEYPDIPNDFDLLEKVPESVLIYRAPIIDPWRRHQKFKKKCSDCLWFPFLNKIVSLLLRLITFPDHMLFWVPFAAVRARQVIKRENIDTVLISSPPDSSQLIGWLLKKTLEIRWVADFRDPIYGNVAQVNMIDPVGVLDRLQKKILYRYDRFIARHADILIANTETHAQRLKDVYGCQNVHVIRNSFDPADFAGTSALPKFEKLTISHVGSIYGKRNADLLFAAINRLAKEFAPEKLKLNVVFLGSGGGGLLESIARYDLAEYVTLIDQVPHKEAIEFMSRSHVLLLIKATGKWSRGQIPGKFFEYVGSGNPVLCIGPRDSEVADIINDCRLGHVVEDSHEEMLGIIRKLYARYLETGALPALMEQQVAPFSSPVMVGKMCTALEGE